MKVKSNLFFCGAMSLGDAIVCGPIANMFAQNADILYVPTQYKFYKTISCLYQDNPKIKVVPFNNPDEENQFIKDNELVRIDSPVIATTMIHLETPPRYIPSYVNWDRQVYEFFDVRYSDRYRNFILPKYIQGEDELFDRLTEGGKDYVLFNQQTGAHPNGVNVDINTFRQAHSLPNIKVIEIKDDITDNMLQYRKLIKHAQEIHCVNTSFFWLVDSLHKQTDARLFYHDRRADSTQQVNTRWNDYRWAIVAYSEKV
jgi:hypothetical protein